MSTTLAKKNRYSRKIHEVDLQFDHAISSYGSTSMRLEASARRKLALQIELDIA